MSAVVAIPPPPPAALEALQRTWEIAFLRHAIADMRRRIEALEAQLAEREGRP